MVTLLLCFLQYSEQNESDGIYCEVCKHMHEPRRVDVIVCFVEEVEDTSSDDESEKEQQQGGDGEHPDKHSDVVYCEK